MKSAFRTCRWLPVGGLNAVALSAVLVLLSTMVSAEEHVIRVVTDYDNLRMVFEPKHLKIKKGDRVTWINEADEEHNVITFPDGFPKGSRAFKSPIMTKAGEQFSHVFEVAGTL